MFEIFAGVASRATLRAVPSQVGCLGRGTKGHIAVVARHDRARVPGELLDATKIEKEITC
jgi:hypothetical protein